MEALGQFIRPAKNVVFAGVPILRGFAAGVVLMLVRLWRLHG
jgi:hypothetical protein